MVSVRPDKHAQEELPHQDLALGICRTSPALKNSNPHLMGSPSIAFLKKLWNMVHWHWGRPHISITREAPLLSFTPRERKSSHFYCENTVAWWPEQHVLNKVNNQVGWPTVFLRQRRVLGQLQINQDKLTTPPQWCHRGPHLPGSARTWVGGTGQIPSPL